jgi:uncharacterized protein (DUF1810 family)
MADLTRFHDAQAGTYQIALAELRAGRKQSHWMWFVFPQLRSLGRSATARHYGIADLDEARAYLADPVLGPRLVEAAGAVLMHRGRPAEAIMGHVDALKLRSSATLFEAAGGDRVFGEVLDAFYGGARCPLTVAELGI